MYNMLGDTTILSGHLTGHRWEHDPWQVKKKDSRLRGRQMGCGRSGDRDYVENFYSGCVDQAVIGVGTVVLPAYETGVVGNA